MEIFFGTNIQLLRKRRKRTQDDVAFATKINRSTYTGFEIGNSFPKVEALIGLSNYFGIAIDTLIRVDLTKLSEFQLSELERGNDVYIRGTHLRVLSKTTDNKDVENIELVPEKAKAGYTTGYADPEYISELPKFQLPFLSKNKKYRSFQISGDSMLPIPDGSWITAEFVEDWHSVQSGKPYIILTIDDGIVFKVVDNLIQDEGSLRLYSLNTLYKPFDVKISSIKEVWKFSNYISSEIPYISDSNDDLRNQLFELTREVATIKNKIDKIE